MSLSWACKHESKPVSKAVLGIVDGEAIDRRVVEMVAERDDIAFETAYAHVADVLRWVAAGNADEDRGAELSPARRAHLVRAARARLLLETEFEPSHRSDDVPLDDPLIERGKRSPQYVRPRLHRVCQLVAVPDVDDEDKRRRLAADPVWRTRARAIFDPVAARMRRYTAGEGLQACKLMTRLLRLGPRSHDDVRLRLEQRAFDLEACSERNPDGSCRRPSLDPTWVEHVAAAAGTGFLPVFTTPFGLHLVHLIDVVPARPLDDPETLTRLQRAVHPRWQRRRFADWLDKLEQKWAVRRAAEVAEVAEVDDR